MLQILLAGVDLDDFEPEDPTCFGVHAMALIGEDATGPADAFDFVVCTPSWLAEQFAGGGDSLGNMAWSDDGDVMFASGLVVVSAWDLDAVRRAVEQVCARQAGPDWGAVASRISRLIPWEYDYRYDRHVDAHPGPAFPPRSETGSALTEGDQG